MSRVLSPSRLLGTAAGLVGAGFVPPLDDDVHPVARFGSTMGDVEELLYGDDRNAGLAYAGVGIGIGLVTGRTASRTAGQLGGTAATIAITTAGHQLRSVATDIGERLEAGDVAGARAALPALVGRDPSELDASGVAAAVVESVAENMVDAVFAPAWWGAVGGAPGAAAYRAVNTMDAMVGRRNDRYEHFGWAAARIDDVANLVPARLFALAVAAARPERAGEVLAAVRADAAAHPSPNAGVAEAAMAGALGVSLGGPLRYGDVHEDRPVLGTGPRPGVGHVTEAVALAERTEQLLIAALAGAGALRLAGRILFFRPRSARRSRR